MKDRKSGHIYPDPNNTARGFKNILVEEKYTESVTRCVTAASLCLKQVLDLIGSLENVVICDTPGFDDSAGAEVVTFFFCLFYS